MRGTPAQRLFAKVEIDDRGCWLWTAAIDQTTGYGRFHISQDEPMAYAHRAAYEMFVGPIPHGLDIDHLCRVRRCVNPRHLEPVTRRENLMRGNTLTAAHAAGRNCGFPKCRSCKNRPLVAAWAEGGEAQ